MRAGASVQWLARGRWFGPGEGHKREKGRRRRLRSAGGGPSRLPPRQKDACLDAGGGCGVSVAGGDQGSIAARKRGACARVVHVRRTSASRESLRSQRKSRKRAQRRKEPELCDVTDGGDGGEGGGGNGGSGRSGGEGGGGGEDGSRGDAASKPNSFFFTPSFSRRNRPIQKVTWVNLMPTFTVAQPLFFG